MSWIGTAGGARSPVDYALTAAAGVVLLGLVGVGLYGTGTGFVQSIGYYRANDLVALLVGFIGAGCALYLLLEWANGARSRLVFFACVLAGMFSAMAVTKGLPAAATALAGTPGSVVFEIVRFDLGGRSCPSTVVAVNPAYEELRRCVTYFDRRKVEIGRHIEVRGLVSGWGILRSDERISG